MTSDALARLRAIAAFAACSDDELRHIDSLLSETKIPAGRTIMTEGHAGLEFIIIQDGEALITQGGREIAVVGPGSWVGEMALIDESLGTRTATVTAKTPITALVMNAGEFTSLLRESPAMRETILRTRALRNHPSGKKA